MRKQGRQLSSVALSVLALGSLGHAASVTQTPAAKTMLTAEPSNGSVVLTLPPQQRWDYARAIVRVRDDGHYPEGISDGDRVAEVSLSSDGARIVHSGLLNGRRYLYAVYAVDSKGHVASRELIAATPHDVEPPGVVQNLRRAELR